MYVFIISDLLWLLVVQSCCFRLTTQQFDFNNFGPGSFPNNGFRGPFPNNEFAGAPPNRGNGPQTPSAIKVNSWLPPGQPLVFSNGGSGNSAAPPTTPSPNPSSPVFVNNAPTNPTMAPFLPAATTPTPEFLQCFQRCPTTSEYNPICATNRQLYGNEQKFNCARSCGAAIQIVRRGSCEGLLPMTRG